MVMAIVCILINVGSRQVELLHSSLPGRKSHQDSLFGLVNHCHTPGGARMLRANLYQPPLKAEVINARMDTVEELAANPGVYHSLQVRLDCDQFFNVRISKYTWSQALVSRFCDVDQLLSLCVVLNRQENLSTFERKLNNVIGVKHALDLVEPLSATVDCAQSPLMQQMGEVLRDESFRYVLD